MFIVNGEDIDSITGEDKFRGYAGYAKSYDFKNNILREYDRVELICLQNGQKNKSMV